MATSGTATFNLDIAEIVEEAYERCGLQARGGYDLRTAKRSINLMMAEWANRGINLWTITKREQLLTVGDADYTLGADIVDVLDHVIRLPAGAGTSAQAEFTIHRASRATYATRTNKLIQAQPTEIYIDRQRDAPIAYLWPVPDEAYTLVYWSLTRMDDAGSYTNNVDVPFRFYEAFISGLAYRIAEKKPAEVPADRRGELLQMAVARFQEAAQEDRDRATMYLVPLLQRV